MSIDLDWHKLDASLAESLVGLINRQLEAAPRPSFIGPIEVASFDFGSNAPDIELVDMRNIHPDFLEAEDDDDDGRDAEISMREGTGDEEDDFEWVSRKAVARAAEDAPVYHHLPPHVRYGHGPTSATDMFASTLALAPTRDMWNGAMSMPNLAGRSPFFAPPEQRSFATTPPRASQPPSTHRTSSDASLDSLAAPSPPEPVSGTSSAPNLQLHLHINWHSNLRITLTTSLLINYPSPMFMSLPIKLSVTGLLFNGELAVAYEGDRRRVHLCILDGADPYGPAARRDSGSETPEEGSSPADEEPEARSRPIGQRLLPNIYIESELGQADKHVLKNVTRVERFIQDVIRKTVEDELVFPNYHVRCFSDIHI